MSRRRATQYLHLEAESDTEEYESSGVSEDLDDLTPITSHKSKSFTELTQELEDKYKEAYPDTEEDGQEDVLEIAPQSQLIPTPRSPLLFLVRCKVGKERDICYRIFERAKNREICSAVHKEGLKGYIYVESFKKQAVEDVLSTIRLVVRTKLSIVPLGEMVEAISYKKNIVVSEFARIRGGKYKGDLVQVLENYEDVVKIKAIPRLNDIKRRFDPGEYRTEVVEKDGGYYYSRDFYRDGYLEKIMLKSNLDFEVEPTFAELSELSIKGSFEINDTVRVSRGDLKNLVGKIENLKGNSVFLCRGCETYEVSLNDIEKHFEVGQEVSYRGENGIVLKICDKTMILGVNNFTSEIECSINDGKPPVAKKQEVPEKPSRFRVRRDPLLNRPVAIRQGEFKGLRGVVKDAYQDKVVVQLRSNFKTVTVDRRVVSSEAQVSEAKGSAGWGESFVGKTPSFKTPTFKTPAFKTPSYRTPSFRTPAFRDGFGMTESHAAEEAGTEWLVSAYDGAEVRSGGMTYVLSDAEGGVFRARTGEAFFSHEIQYCEPEKYERVVIMEGDSKGAEGILISIDGKKGVVKGKDGHAHSVEITSITRKAE